MNCTHTASCRMCKAELLYIHIPKVAAVEKMFLSVAENKEIIGNVLKMRRLFSAV